MTEDRREGDAVADKEVDPFVTYDAAYVLGALAPEERVAFEKHLRGCDRCSNAVLELAAMPGLLAQGRVEPGWAETPPDVLPALLGKVHKVRRRRWLGFATTTATAGAACLTLVLMLLLGGSEPIGEAGRQMQALAPIPVEARATLTKLSHGTRVDMACSYRGGKEGDYLLVAVRKDGSDKVLATWNAMPEDTARMSIGTTLRRTDIVALEIRLVDGTPILRLTS